MGKHVTALTHTELKTLIRSRVLEFIDSHSPEEVAAFFNQQLAKEGETLFTPAPGSKAMASKWLVVKNGDTNGTDGALHAESSGKVDF